MDTLVLKLLLLSGVYVLSAHESRENCGPSLRESKEGNVIGSEPDQMRGPIRTDDLHRIRREIKMGQSKKDHVDEPPDKVNPRKSSVHRMRRRVTSESDPKVVTKPGDAIATKSEKSVGHVTPQMKESKKGSPQMNLTGREGIVTSKNVTKKWQWTEERKRRKSKAMKKILRARMNITRKRNVTSKISVGNVTKKWQWTEERKRQRSEAMKKKGLGRNVTSKVASNMTKKWEWTEGRKRRTSGVMTRMWQKLKESGNTERIKRAKEGLRAYWAKLRESGNTERQVNMSKIMKAYWANNKRPKFPRKGLIEEFWRKRKEEEGPTKKEDTIDEYFRQRALDKKGAEIKSVIDSGESESEADNAEDAAQKVADMINDDPDSDE